MGYFENSSDEAESSFYAAFENLDLDLMKATWHQADNVYCIHPGGPAQTGYDAVLNHWAYILGDNQATNIEYRVISVEKHGNFAIHLVEESIGSDKVKVLATNTYIYTDNGWRLYSHHASLPPPQKEHVAEVHPVH
jgi:hypothetical protein